MSFTLFFTSRIRIRFYYYFRKERNLPQVLILLHHYYCVSLVEIFFVQVCRRLLIFSPQFPDSLARCTLWRAVGIFRRAVLVTSRPTVVNRNNASEIHNYYSES